MEINGSYPLQGAVTFRGCWALVREVEIRKYKVSSLMSPCTDHLCDGISSYGNDPKNNVGILYCIDKPDLLELAVQQIHVFEEISGLRKTRLLKLETSKDKYLLVPDKKILSYTVLASLYLKILRNTMSRKTLITDETQFDKYFWYNPADLCLGNYPVLSRILFTGRLKDLVKTSPIVHGNKSGHVGHASQGIHYNLSQPGNTYFGDQIKLIAAEK